jgi:hypothetical protein
MRSCILRVFLPVVILSQLGGTPRADAGLLGLFARLFGGGRRLGQGFRFGGGSFGRQLALQRALFFHAAGINQFNQLNQFGHGFNQLNNQPNDPFGFNRSNLDPFGGNGAFDPRSDVGGLDTGDFDPRVARGGIEECQGVLRDCSNFQNFSGVQTCLVNLDSGSLPFSASGVSACALANRLRASLCQDRSWNMERINSTPIACVRNARGWRGGVGDFSQEGTFARGEVLVKLNPGITPDQGWEWIEKWSGTRGGRAGDWLIVKIPEGTGEEQFCRDLFSHNANQIGFGCAGNRYWAAEGGGSTGGGSWPRY